MMTARARRNSAVFFWLSVLGFLAGAVLWALNGSVAMSIDMLLPLALYGAAHAMRAVRLWVLLGGGGGRRLLGLYAYTAACSALIPFKLGELVRINEIANWTRSYWRGLLIVWIERAFDVVVIGAIALCMLLARMSEPKDIGVLLWLIGVFVFLTVLFFFVLPEQLCQLNLHVMRSYRGNKAIAILRTLDSLYVRLEQVRPMIAGKIITLSLLTGFVWGAELLALYRLADALPSAAAGLVRNFSSLLTDAGAYAHVAGLPLSGFESIKVLFLIVAGALALWFYSMQRFQALRGSEK